MMTRHVLALYYGTYVTIATLISMEIYDIESAWLICLVFDLGFAYNVRCYSRRCN